MSVTQNADGSWSAHDSSGNVIISNTTEEYARKNDAENQKAYGGSSSASSGGGGTADTGGVTGTNLGQDQLEVTAAYNQAQIEYLRERLRLVDVPMMETEKDRLAFQKAQAEVENALAQDKFKNIDLPMLKLQQDQLVQARGDLSMKGVQIASTEATSRAQLGLQGLGQAEQAGLSRQQLAQQGMLGSEQLARDADQFALSGANALNQTALGAIGLNAQFRGPRDAWVQQQVNRGLNAAGLTRDVGAIAGEYGAPAFQAPQATPQAASMQSAVADMLGAGGFRPGQTPNDIIRQQVQNRVANPYGAAGAMAFGQAAGMAANPYGQYGSQLGQASAGQLADQYTSPSAYAALQMGYGNLQEGMPNAPSMRVRGMGQQIYDTWSRLNQALGRRPTDEEMGAAYAQVTGLPQDIALKLARDDTAVFRATGAPRPVEGVEQAIVGAYTQLGPQMSPGEFGTPERVGRAWYNTTGGTNYLPYNDPRTLGIYRDVAHVNPFQAPDAAETAAQWYKSGGYTMPGGQFNDMIRDPTQRQDRIGFRRIDDPYGGSTEFIAPDVQRTPESALTGTGRRRRPGDAGGYRMF
jgi:hypothetical protein